MTLSAQAQKAETLRALHRGPKILILPNAWDVASARIVEDLGFPAIATTSAGIAAVLGYADGEQISREEMLDSVARIAAAVRVPVTADFEAGYGPSLDDVAISAKSLVEAGAVGLNFEDIIGRNPDLVETSLQVQKIQKLCAVSSAAMGVPLVVNARTDVYLKQIGSEQTRFDRTVERLRAYQQAGASCVFAPGLSDAPTIAKLVKAVDCPLNILLLPNCPPIDELQKLGVARVSAGSGVMRSALGHARRVAQELLRGGAYPSLFEGAVPFADVNKLMARHA
jgi:2-methylisocitrate lyase-like PEP mutase family enzyme